MVDLKQIFLDFNKNYEMSEIVNLDNDIYNITKFNKYFDRIFVLNLNRRLDRWKTILNTFNKYGIYNYERFEAINGYEEPYISEYNKMRKTINKCATKVDKFKLMKTPGSYGILKSTIEIINLAKQRNYRSILILQDDIIFINDFYKYFNNLIYYIPENYKLLYFGASQHSWTNININFNRPYYKIINNPTCGAFAIGINREIFDELLDLMKKYYYYPIDEGAFKIIQEKYNDDCYIAYPNIIISDLRDSDLRNSRSMEYNIFKWEINLYDY